MKSCNLKPGIVGAITLLGASCGFSHTKTQNSPPSNANSLLTESIGYAEVNQYVFSVSCVSCHNSGNPNGGVNLDNYASVKSQIGNIQQQAILTSNMPLPPSPALTPFQKQLLSNWIAQGAPEQGSANPNQTPPPGSTPTPVPPSPTPAPAEAQVLDVIRANFSLFVKPLVQKGCMDCHDASATPEGFGKLPIIRSIEWRHIHEASAVLDFSLPFPNWSVNSSDPLYYLNQLQGVIVNHTMPLEDYKIPHEILHDGKVLNAIENEIILNWISNSIQLLASVNTTPPTAIQYFSSTCLGCHNSTLASGGFSFQQSGGQVILPTGKASNGMAYVTPFDPENSALYLVLLTDSTKRDGLPQMPDGGSASEQDQQLIYDWIKQGAK